MTSETPDLNSFYSDIENKIKIISAHLDIPEYEFIFKSCRLKPVDLFYSLSKGKKIKYCSKWFDEFGNSLTIKNKNIQVIYNDLSIDKSKIVNTDLYDGLDLDNTLKISKLCYLSESIDEFKNIHYLFGFLGIDNYLRCFKLHNKQINKLSPLYIRQEILLKIAQNSDKEICEKIYNKRNSMLKQLNNLLFSLPISQDTFIKLNTIDTEVANFFKGEK